MRVIKSDFQDKEKEYEIVCPHCKSKLAYYNTDIRDSYESVYVVCPCCHNDIIIDSTPTVNEVQYPKDFFSYADGVSIDNTRVNEWVKKCVDDLDEDTDYAFRASGDTIVFAYKSDEDLPAATVIVAKKYQECDVKISRKNF